MAATCLGGIPGIVFDEHFSVGRNGSGARDPNRYILISYRDHQPMRYQALHRCEQGYRVEEINPDNYFVDMQACLDTLTDFDHNVFTAAAYTIASIVCMMVASFFCSTFFSTLALVAAIANAIWCKDELVGVMTQNSVYQVDSQHVIIWEPERQVPQSSQVLCVSESSVRDSLFYREPTEDQIAAKRFIVLTLSEGAIKAGTNQTQLVQRGDLLKEDVHPLKQLVIIFTNKELVAPMKKLLGFTGMLDKQVKNGYIHGTRGKPGMGPALQAAHEKGDIEPHLEFFCMMITKAGHVIINADQLRPFISGRKPHWENFLRTVAGLEPVR